MEKPVLELYSVHCDKCKQNHWNVSIGHVSTGGTRLVVICGNPQCEGEKDEDGDTIFISREFDITGQGYDDEDPTFYQDLSRDTVN